MKVSVPKDFGNTSKNHVLPLVPAPIKSIKKEDLTTVNLYSDPGDHNSTQVKFSFKGLDGDHETPREILEWRRNVDQALTGLNLNANGLSSYNMCKQFMRGSALSTFIAKAGAILVNKKAEAIVTAEKPRDNYPTATEAGYILADFTALRVAVTTANTRNTLDQLTEAYGPEVVCMYVNCPPVSKWWERPVRAFAPRKGHPPLDAPQSGAGDWQLARLASWVQTSSPAAPILPPGFTPK